MIEGLYLSAEVVSMTGCTYRQLDYWRARDWITPTAARKHNPRFTPVPFDARRHRNGWVHLWNASTLDVIRTVKSLLDEGYPPAAIERAFERAWERAVEVEREGVG